jgi:tRNA-2-methylthio-N6-dimethylallyladenosine synthase
MADGLIAAHGDVESLMPFLHLPVQSGSDRILRAMNRAHDVASYLRLLDRVRAARPDIAISGDYIVGFPGETEAEFEETLAVIRAVGHAQAFSFKYSPRTGTPAATMPDQIAPQVMDDRLARLQALVAEQQLAFNRATIGRTCEILIERNGKLPGQKLGKSPWLQSTLIDGGEIGDLVEVEIVSAGPQSLSGERPQRAAA